MALNCGVGLDFQPHGQSQSTCSRLAAMRAVSAELEAYFLLPKSPQQLLTIGFLLVSNGRPAACFVGLRRS